jgi:hypothetical protein
MDWRSRCGRQLWLLFSIVLQCLDIWTTSIYHLKISRKIDKIVSASLNLQRQGYLSESLTLYQNKRKIWSVSHCFGCLLLCYKLPENTVAKNTHGFMICPDSMSWLGSPNLACSHGCLQLELPGLIWGSWVSLSIVYHLRGSDETEAVRMVEAYIPDCITPVTCLTKASHKTSIV